MLAAPPFCDPAGMATEDIADAIDTAAEDGILEVEGDAGRVKQHSLTERLDAMDRLASRTASTSPHRGIRFTKLKPPGTD